MSHGPMNHDIIARKLPDGRYNIVQWVAGKDQTLEGPLTRSSAEARALDLAHRSNADAWIEVASGAFHLL